MSEEKNTGKDGTDQPMERRSFLKKIGIAGGAALAHFFVLGKPSTAFGGREPLGPGPVEVLPIPVRSRCRPISISTAAGPGDRGDDCYVKDGRREVGDHCFIRRTKQGNKEVGDQCLVANGWAEIGDQCQIRKDRQGNEVEVGDQCGGWTVDPADNHTDDTGDQCFISHQSNQEVAGSDLCTTVTPPGGAIEESGDQCRVVCRAGAPPEEVGDECLDILAPDGTITGEVGDQCWHIPGTTQEFGDQCNIPNDTTVDTGGQID